MNPVNVSPRSIPSTQDSGPIRTLVMSADAGYHDRACAVLGELGPVAFALSAPTDADVIASLADHEQAAVVVLDATGCEPEVRAVVGELAAGRPRLGVVVVCEHLTGNDRALDALPKWGWTRDLRVAVQRAHDDRVALTSPEAFTAATARRERHQDARVRTSRR